MKFTFISDGQVTDVYEASSKDDLVNNFTPDAFKELVEIPDEAEHGMKFDGTTLDPNIPVDDRTDEQKARDIELAKPENIKKHHEDVFDKGITRTLPKEVQEDAALLATMKADYLASHGIS